MDKNRIRVFVLKTLATRFEDRNPIGRLSTFTASTPEEERPLSEVLAELRAEGSIAEFIGTYQFTPRGYDRYRSQIEWLRSTE